MHITTMIRHVTLTAILSMQGGCLFGAVIPVTDGNVVKGRSPYNWVCKDDSISSTVNGASIALKFKGTRRVALQVATDHLTTKVPARFPIIAWSVNGGVLQTHQLAAKENSVLLSSGIADPRIELYIKGMSPFEDRYSGDVPGNALKITGFAVDQGGSAMTVVLPGKVWLNIGDSIMSGDGAAYAQGQGRPPDDAWAASEDGRASYGYLLAQHYGYREARIAYGGYNWGGGMAGIPALSTLIDHKTSTVSRLNGEKLSPIPDVVLVNLGANGAPAAGAVTQALGKLRSRVSQATKIFVMIPVSGRGRAEVTQAFNSYKNSAKDENAQLVDLGHVTFATCDGVHPTAAGHQVIFKAALPIFEKLLGEAGKSSAKRSLGQPFWRTKVMENEPVLFVQEKRKSVASGKLLFVPGAKPTVAAPDLVMTYEEGKDYLWKPGSNTIELTTGSRIPFKTAAQMVPPPGSPNTLLGVLFSEGRFFHDLQVQVTYEHADIWPLQDPPQPQRLSRSLAKLKTKQPLKLVALGDSITEGYNASGFRPAEAPPYQPAYPQLVANTLQVRFGSPVTLANLGRAGTGAGWGLGMVAKVAAEKPDLVILAFGMNHSEPAPAFEAVMRKLRDAVQAKCPEADIVLVAPMTGNPRSFPAERFIGYRDALRNLTRPNVTLADVTSPWLELLKRKPFSDLSGNNINHPNDFGHRLYAEVICQLLPSTADFRPSGVNESK
jgi:lysophospholipase L1-like esterase